MILRDKIVSDVYGYPSATKNFEVTDKASDDYISRQNKIHKIRVDHFLMPILNGISVSSILDVGCGAGMMVQALMEVGYDSYGVDIPAIADSWKSNKLPRNRFVVIDRNTLSLPFEDDTFDFVYSLGVLEHVGTSDGYADRLPEYNEIRREWLKEVFRVVKPQGYLLILAPNKHFPLDTHGPDNKASKIEKWIHKKTRFSIHKMWGNHFNVTYNDINIYLKGLSYSMTALRPSNYYTCERKVPKIAKPFFKFYLEYLPKQLLMTGFNPLVLALIKKV